MLDCFELNFQHQSIKRSVKIKLPVTCMKFSKNSNGKFMLGVDFLHKSPVIEIVFTKAFIPLS